MNYFDMNNFLMQSSKLTANSDTDSLASTEIRDRALSNSSVGSQDCLPSNNFYGQNNFKDLNLLLALLTSNQQQQQQNTQSMMIEKGRSNSDASSSSAEDFKGLFDLNGFSLFSQNQYDRRAGSQVFIPKPIRSQSKSNSFLFDLGVNSTNSNSSPSNQQSSVSNLLLEASLNIFQNLMRKDSSSEISSQNISSVQQQSQLSTSSTSSNVPQQSQIMYQPNIIFGVQLTPEEMQKRRELRRQKIEKYLTKKQTRKWDVLRYEVRKKIAKTRQRVKGRFVKEEKSASDDSQMSNLQLKSPNSTQIVLSDDQMNSADNI